MLPIISISVGKGGNGKTTTAVNLAATIAREGSCLLVDMDPSGNATGILAPDAYGQPGLDALLKQPNGLDPADYLHDSRIPGVAVLPCGPDLGSTGDSLLTAPGGDRALARTLAALNLDAVDVVIIDTSPTLARLTLNAAVAATHVISPTAPTRMSVEGVLTMYAWLEQMRALDITQAKFVGAVLGRVQARASAHEIAIEDLEAAVPVFKTRIPERQEIQQAELMGLTAVEGKKTGLARTYMDLWEEIRGTL